MRYHVTTREITRGATDGMIDMLFDIPASVAHVSELFTGSMAQRVATS